MCTIPKQFFLSSNRYRDVLQQADMSGGGYDMTLFSQTLAPSQFTSSAPADFLGDNLVAAPNKVTYNNIPYN